jgi:large subunit ribosomal protein L24e
MTKCVFCGREEDSFKGIHVMCNDGSVSYYCSGKCRKNQNKLGRDKKKIKWTEAFRVARAKESAKIAEAKVAKKSN